MRFIKGFFQFWYDFIVGDCWEIAAGVVIILGLGAILISTEMIALHETIGLIEGATVTTKLYHPTVPLVVAASLMLLLVGSVYREFRRKLDSTK
jgi:hypothetical protein